MKKSTMFLFLVCFILAGCSRQDHTTLGTAVSSQQKLQIQVIGQSNQKIVFELNDSAAAKELYEQLPITVEIENFSSDEKIFYPDQNLDVTNAPAAAGPAGTLAYYAPWGDVAMYYDTCNGADGLYELGEAISGSDLIEHLSGTIRIEQLKDAFDHMDETAQSNPENRQDQMDSGTVANDHKEESDSMFPINITVGNQVFSAHLYDSETSRAFISRLPLTLSMDELHGNEKYYYFSEGFPTSQQPVSQIHTGDIKLFGSDCLVLFYKDFSTSYSYTSLGQIDDPSGWMEALGTGSVTIVFEETKE